MTYLADQKGQLLQRNSSYIQKFLCTEDKRTLLDEAKISKNLLGWKNAMQAKTVILYYKIITSIHNLRRKNMVHNFPINRIFIPIINRIKKYSMAYSTKQNYLNNILIK